MLRRPGNIPNKVLIAAAALSLTAVTAGISPAASAAGRPPAPSIAATHVSPRSAVPWRRVGPGWVLAQYWPGRFADPGQAKAAPVTLYLISPAGHRYLLRRWAATKKPLCLTDWSGDKTRVLLFRPAQRPAGAADPGHRPGQPHQPAPAGVVLHHQLHPARRAGPARLPAGPRPAASWCGSASPAGWSRCWPAARMTARLCTPPRARRSRWLAPRASSWSAPTAASSAGCRYRAPGRRVASPPGGGTRGPSWPAASRGARTATGYGWCPPAGPGPGR